MPMLWTNEMNPMENQGSGEKPRKFDKDGRDVTDEPADEALQSGQEQLSSGATSTGPKDPPDEDEPDDKDDEPDDDGEASRPTLGKTTYRSPGRSGRR